jgi:hypothetical protein
VKSIARISCFSFLAFTAVLSNVSLAFADPAVPESCTNSTADDEDPSRSTARILIAYVDRNWDLAKTTKPLRESVSLEDDPSADGTKLEYHDAHFRTFEVGFFRYPDGTLLPASMSTSSPKFRLPCGLKLGQSPKQVSQTLGTPTYAQSSTWIYATGGDQNGEVALQFRRNRLQRVSWAYDTH